MKAMVVRKSARGSTPIGGIVFWSGLDTTIPTGWAKVEVPVGAYLKAVAPANVSYTLQGSASHEHLVADTGSGGIHGHTASASVAISYDRRATGPWPYTTLGKSPQDHSHPAPTATVGNSASHIHTLGTTPTANNQLVKQKYWMIKSQAGAPERIGMIVMWANPQAQIPSGWRLCDGSTIDGVTVPLITEGFWSMPASNADTGQSGTYSHGHALTVTGSSGAHTHPVSTGSLTKTGSPESDSQGDAGESIASINHTHGGMSGTTPSTGAHVHDVGGMADVEMFPPFMRLYFIIKVF